MDYKDKYKQWQDDASLDLDMRSELESMDEDAIKEAFHADLSFGTGGLRGQMGVGTNRVNIYTIRKATEGFARYLQTEGLMDGVAIAYDNRRDSETFALESGRVLAAHGIPSFIFPTLRPTPMLSYAVRYYKASGGIMITASHNPKSDNGYKVYNATGAQVNLDEAAAIIKAINQIDDPFAIKTLDSSLIQWIGEDLERSYLDEVRSIRINDVDKTAVRIVYSPLHGTGGTVIPGLLRDEGYDVHPYEPQMIISPDFPNTRSSNPEEKEAFERPVAFAAEIGADLVMVTDPDADRLGIAVLHEDGYTLLSGNQTAVIELDYILNQRQANNTLPDTGIIYTTNVTTDLVHVIAEAFGYPVVTTLTGFKFIGEQAWKNRQEGEYLFGCEESYGSLVKDFVLDKDAVQAVYLLAEIACHVKAKGMTLVDYLETIYKTYGHYHEYTENIKLAGLEGKQKIAQIMTRFRKDPPLLKGLTLKAFDDFKAGVRYENGQSSPLGLPSLDVLKFMYEEDTWMVLRPSGTEPKLKIYYGTKQADMAQAKQHVDILNQQMLAMIEDR